MYYKSDAALSVVMLSRVCFFLTGIDFNHHYLLLNFTDKPMQSIHKVYIVCHYILSFTLYEQTFGKVGSL